MSKMFFDKCGGCCKNDCNKKEGDKSGSFGSNQEKIQEGGSMNKAPFDKSNDNNKKENGKPEQNQGQNQGKWQEKSDKKDTAKCNHGTNCHCGHDSCKECSKH